MVKSKSSRYRRYKAKKLKFKKYRGQAMRKKYKKAAKRFRRRRPKALNITTKLPLTRSFKHYVQVIPNTRTILAPYNDVKSVDVMKNMLASDSYGASTKYETGDPVIYSATTYRMDSVYDPQWATMSGVFSTPATYHTYTSVLYNEYRVIKSTMTVYVTPTNIFSGVPSATGATSNKQRYNSPMMVSIKMDDNMSFPTTQCLYWTNLLSDPNARTMRVFPSMNDGVPHTYKLSATYRLPKELRDKDDTWSPCSTNPTSTDEAKALATIVLQREDITATTPGTDFAAFPFTMRIQINYLVKYRYPKDTTRTLTGQMGDEAEPDSEIIEEEKVVEVPAVWKDGSKIN